MKQNEIFNLQTALAWAYCEYHFVLANIKPWNVPKVVCECVNAFLIYQKQSQWAWACQEKAARCVNCVTWWCQIYFYLRGLQLHVF